MCETGCILALRLACDTMPVTYGGFGIPLILMVPMKF